jgi:hypothetical protein
MEEVVSFYLHLHDRLWKHVNPTRVMDITEAKKLIGKAYNIPSSLQYIVLKEMEYYKLIEIVDRYKIKLIKSPCDVANNTGKISKRLKIF